MAQETSRTRLVRLMIAHIPNDGYNEDWLDAASDKVDAAGDGKVTVWLSKIERSAVGFVPDYVGLKTAIDVFTIPTTGAPAGESISTILARFAA